MVAADGFGVAAHDRDEIGATDGAHARFPITAGAALRDRLFALQILGDDRAVARTYVKGRLLHDRDGLTA